MILNSYMYGGGAPSLYSGIAGAFSLRKFNDWDNAILQIERSSDSATAYVFIDGASVQNEVSLSSYISTTSDTTPSTTTLSTWLSTDNALVNRWYFQETDGVVNRYIDETSTKRPTFATAGVIDTENSLSAISFSGGTQRLKRTSPVDNYPELENTENWTCIIVSNNDTAGANSIIMSTSITSTSFAMMFNSRHSAARAARILHSGTNIFADLTAQVDSANQRIITMVRDSTNIISYYNGTLQNTTAHSSLAYTDNSFQIGNYWGGASGGLNGTIQEVIIIAEATPSNLGDIHTDIDTYYSIP